jgi:hypothetical protein
MGWNLNHYILIWPPCSPDLTPFDFYLWGYMKDLMILEKLQTWDEHLWHSRTVLLSIGTSLAWKHIGSNTCCFKMSSLVHSQCRMSFRTANCVSMNIMWQRTLNMSRIPFLCRWWFISSIKIMSFNLHIWISSLSIHHNYVTIQISTHVDINFFSQNKLMNNHPKFGRSFVVCPVYTHTEEPQSRNVLYIYIYTHTYMCLDIMNCVTNYKWSK